jgi:tetratricopeptide (TPR) repeat protein
MSTTSSADELLNRCTELNRLGRYEEAVDCYGKVIKIDPKNTDAWNGKIGALKQLGREEEAQNCFQEFIQSIPDMFFRKLSFSD